ncbi:inner membrane protein associated with alginate biosynthesis [Escherichia coli]|nr:inner membrane protein associated with alginate biosynthesis [Escherichia coli]
MGLVIKAALGALVVLLIGVLAKTKNYYIAGLIPLFPDLCAYRALYCCQRTRH